MQSQSNESEGQPLVIGNGVVTDGVDLFIEQGAILINDQREFCRGWPNQTEVTVPGNHFLQEDSPHEIGEAIAEWRKGIA